MQFTAVVCLIAAVLQLAVADRLDAVSFEKPFETISADGERLVGTNWEIGGSTVVNRHFVRLTPDRQSRRGYVWSKEKLGHQEFSLMMTFRISGQAHSWFGDGLALWITTSPRHVQGDNHGFTGKFKGFGLIFDTFVNQEHAGGHKDVTFIENDGTKTLDDINEQPKVGCMAPGIRYHEQNAAFSPSLNVSRVKVQYFNHFVTVSLDPTNTGEWFECHRTRLSFPEDWIPESTIGITASTGGLADNHDVLSLNVYK
jgi:mannose-binding lectin 2